MKRQYYGDPIEKQDMFIDDFDEVWRILDGEITNRAVDLFTKGILGNITITKASSTQLNIPAFVFYLNGNRVSVSAGNRTIDTTTNGTFYLYVSYTETIIERNEERERRLLDKKHRRIDYTPVFSISTSSSDTTKVKLARVTIVSNAIDTVDNASTYRNYASLNIRLLSSAAGSGLLYDIVSNVLSVNKDLALSDIYGDVITIKPNLGERFKTLEYLNYEYDTSINLYHGLWRYNLRDSEELSTNEPLITIPNIPCRPYESFIVEFDAYTDNGSNSLKVRIVSKDKNGNIVNVDSASITISTGWNKYTIIKNASGLAGGLIANQDDACYVDIQIINNNYVTDSTVSFSPPIIKRKSKNQEIHEFIISRTGTGAWTIVENSDGILSSISIDYHLVEFNFTTGVANFFKYKCEAFPYMFEGSVGYRYNMLHEDISAISKVSCSYAYYDANMIRVGFMEDATKSINVNGNIATHTNYVKLILKRNDTY